MASGLAELSPEQIREYKEAGVLEQVIESFKNDPTSGLAFARPVYAPRSGDPTAGGIFTQPGVRPDMVSALNQPLDITSILNPKPSIYAQERIGILTGQTVTTGTNPNDTCSDPVRPGQLKTCQQNYIFGEFFIGSEKIKISDAGMFANRGVTARRILNEAPINPFLPAVLQGNNVDFESIEAQQLYQIGTALRRAIVKVMISGDPATIPASAEPGFVKEFLGLNSIIKTGYTDVITGVACPAADSTVVNFNADINTGTDSLGRNIATVITDTYFGKKALDMQLGTSAQWMWVMPYQLFRELAYAYANHYYETRSVGVVGNPFFTNQEGIRRLQLEMFNGRYLLIDGEAVPVMFSDGITISAGGGNNQKADIFLVPISVNGRDGINFEFFPMNNPNAQRLASRFNNEIQMLNNGMMILYAERKKGCMELDIEGKCRMYLEAPFLAAKIQNLIYASNVSYRSPLPAGTGYVNGGQTGYFPINVGAVN
jgi:hypothetical protein